jgi:peptide alpha-N-acetyltransferase
MAETNNNNTGDAPQGELRYCHYTDDSQMPPIMRLMEADLSEPYSVYTYQYFIHNWPKLCWLVYDGDKCVGAVVCKLDQHKNKSFRGYIAMLAVESSYRRRKIGSVLVSKAIEKMKEYKCEEVVLETEITNKGAINLYLNLGFIKDKRLQKYYLNGVDAFRLKLALADDVIIGLNQY